MKRLLAGLVLMTAGAASAQAADIKVLSIEAMRPVLQQIAPAYEADSKNKLKIDYAAPDAVEKQIAGDADYDIVILDKERLDKLYKAAHVAGGSIKSIAKKGSETFDAATSNWTDQPLPSMAVIDFLHGPKAAEAYKANGMQPG
jgi:ABC-type molybdate transport system substrate-binding protein